jgi:hypothetical protein
VVQRSVVLATVIGLVASADAGSRYEHMECDPYGCPVDDELPRQIEADLGLSVIQLAFEQPLTAHVSASLSAGIFGSYFLPWFERGDDVIGVGGGARVTWFARTSGRGLYVAPYVRVHRVSGDHDGMEGTGLGVTAGAFVGWAFRLHDKLDLRVGAGAQYIRHTLDLGATTETTSTPFLALDLVVGYRL